MGMGIVMGMGDEEPDACASSAAHALCGVSVGAIVAGAMRISPSSQEYNGSDESSGDRWWL
jgi:hypothetical protein